MANTVLDYSWQLSCRLLPFFHRHTLRQITIAEVDSYRDTKLREGRISAVSINKTITRLAQILQVAVEYGHIEQNPAVGRRRRLRVTRPAPVWLDRAEQIEALLAAAGELDADARADRQLPRRTILATLVFAGLRIGELTALRWRDVDLAGNRIFVRESKTDAGRRTIELLPQLRDKLATHKGAPVAVRGRGFRLSDARRKQAERQQHPQPHLGKRRGQRERASGRDL